MTTSFISTTITGAGPLFSYTAVADALVILPGATLGSTTGAAIANTGLDNLSLDVLGTLVASSIISFGGSNAFVHIGVGATFFSNDPFSGSTALYLSGTGQSLINEGSLIAPHAIAVLSDGGNSIANHGTMSGSSGAFIGLFGGNGDRLTNSGTIVATDFDDANRDIRYNNGVFTEGAGSVVTNLATGTMTAVSSEGAGVRMHASAGGSSVANYGHIESMQDFGVNLGTVTAGQALIEVSNWGTITGFDGAYNGSVNADLLFNRGILDGDVFLGADVDTFDNRGGTVTGTVFGEAGTDTFVLNAAWAETVDGGTEVDAIDFRFGPAVVVALDSSFENEGAALGDTYFSIERVLGSVYADVIRGGTAADQLLGQAGADSIDGAAGNDLLRGGQGVDTLTGGAGNDTFRFQTLNENGDVITDFSNVGGNDDKFQIGGSAFGGGLVVGALAANQFQSRADNVAQDADDRFVYRTTDRTLWFDDDGNGAHAAVMVADLQPGATVTAADIFII